MRKLMITAVRVSPKIEIKSDAQGVEYEVAPAVAIVAGVLNGELVPADEIGRYPETWGGIPLVVNHPVDAEGDPISANSPAIPRYGFFFNPRFEEDRLHGELWMNAAALEKAGGEPLQALTRLRNGEPLELSTAFYRDIEERGGVFNNRRYNQITRNIRPDHLALLPNDLGACSWSDGCGAPRVNKQGTRIAAARRLVTNQDDVQNGVMIALFVRPADRPAFPTDPAFYPAGSEVVAPEDLHLTLCYLGDKDEIEVSEGDLLSRLTWASQNFAVVPAKVKGVGVFNTEQEVLPVWAVIESDALGQFRQMIVEILWGVKISRRHNFIPHVTLAYVPANEVSFTIPQAREIVFDSVALAWGDRVTTFNLQGNVETPFDVLVQNVASFVESRGENCHCEEGGATPNNNTLEGGNMSTQTNNDQPVTPDAAATPTQGEPTLQDVMNQIGELAQKFGTVEQRLQAVEGVAANVNAAAQSEKDQTVARILANGRNVLSEAALRALPEADLYALASSLQPTEFAVNRGSGFSQNGDLEPYVLPNA